MRQLITPAQCLFAALALVLPAAQAATATPDRRIEIDFSQANGTIRPLHGVNSGPISEHFTVDLSRSFRELAIPHVRLIAPNYPGTDCVHIQTIFPNFAADPDNPANYEFKRTDDYVAAVLAVGATPIYNLGLGIDKEWLGGEFRFLSNRPPDDFQKWARVCLNILRHYNDGWAGGFRHGIRHWEIWNEPDIVNFWGGTFEQYMELYATVARTLKAHDATLQVGGPALAGHLSWLEQFLSACQQRGLPLDFCSWHCYAQEPGEVVRMAREVRRLLVRHGFSQTQSHLSEWSPKWMTEERMRRNPLAAREFFDRNGSCEGAAFDAGVLCALQDSPVDIAEFYCGDTLRWGFIDRSGAPKTSYYGFKAFRQILATPHRVVASGSAPDQGFVVLAGLAPDRTRAGILIASRLSDPDARQACEIRLTGLPWRAGTIVSRHLVDRTHELDAVAIERHAAGEATPAIKIESVGSSVHFVELVDVTRGVGRLAVLAPVVASSTAPDQHGSEHLLLGKWRDLPDPVLRASGSPRSDHVFWASDGARDRAPALKFDLGLVREVTEVRLGFPTIAGQHAFMPSQVEVAISDDGQQFRSVAVGANLPVEGATHHGTITTLPVAARGRYVRLSFAPSRTQGAQNGRVQIRSVDLIGR